MFIRLSEGRFVNLRRSTTVRRRPVNPPLLEIHEGEDSCFQITDIDEINHVLAICERLAAYDLRRLESLEADYVEQS